MTKPCTTPGCRNPATFAESGVVVAACARLGRPVPQLCDSCVWERLEASVAATALDELALGADAEAVARDGER